MRAVKYFLLSLLFSSPAFAQDQWANNAYSTLASGITAVSTTFTVATGEGSRFPTPGNGYYLTLESGSIATPTAREIVRVTARSGDVFTVTRARQSTSASIFAAGSRVSFRITAQSLREFMVGSPLIRTSSSTTWWAQPHLSRKPIYQLPIGGVSTSLDVMGPSITAGGSATARTVGTTWVTQHRRLAYVSSAAATNAFGLISNTVPVYYRSTTTGLGGVTFTARYFMETATANQHLFCGLFASTSGTFMANVNYTTVGGIMADIVSVGAQNTDTNLQIYHNNGSGAPVSSNLGANFPAFTNSTDIYTIQIMIPVGPANSIWVYVLNETTGASVISELTSELPTNNTLLRWGCGGSTGTGGAVTWDVISVVVDTPY